MSHQHSAAAPLGRAARIFAFVKHEFRQVLPPTIFFFVGFNIILFSKRLMLAEHLIQFSGFFIATMSALVVGKVVLVADKMPFLRRYDNAPLIRPILFKTLVYTLLVGVVRLIEAFLHYVAGGGALGGGAFLDDLLGTFSWDRFIAVQMWLFILFLVYVTASEFNSLLGDGELFRILFRRHSSELKLIRRQRIRQLVRLSHLMEAHPFAELEERGTKAHAELVAILRTLGRAERTS